MSITQTIFFSNKSISNSQHDENNEACIANISPKERQLRKRAGVVFFAVALFVLSGLVALDVNPLWRLLLFFLFSAATTSYIQALDKT